MTFNASTGIGLKVAEIVFSPRNLSATCDSRSHANLRREICNTVYLFRSALIPPRTRAFSVVHQGEGTDTNEPAGTRWQEGYRFPI